MSILIACIIGWGMFAAFQIGCKVNTIFYRRLLEKSHAAQRQEMAALREQFEVMDSEARSCIEAGAHRASGKIV